MKRKASKVLRSMLCVDFRRMFTQPLLYIMIGAAFVIPILVLVMTTMMDGTTTVNPQTGVETTIEAFKSTWQAIGTVSGTDAGMAMDLTSMCNINLMYFIVSVLVCLFVAEDFRSGFAKNLFTVRGKKGDYVASKTIVCILGGCLMLLAFFVGALIGGAVSGLPFTMDGFHAATLVLCLITKLLLMAVFVPIYVVMSVIAKHRSWMSILLCLMTGMFMFMMIPMLTPLNANLMHVILCGAGAVGFIIGLGAVSNTILKKTSLV